MLFKNSVRTSKRTPHFTITTINWLTLFKFNPALSVSADLKPSWNCEVRICTNDWVIVSSFHYAFSVTRLYNVDSSVTSEWWIHENKHPCLKRDSNPRSQCPSDQGLWLWPRGYWDQLHHVFLYKLTNDSKVFTASIIRAWWWKQRAPVEMFINFYEAT
jgi:hypothetical protein